MTNDKPKWVIYDFHDDHLMCRESGNQLTLTIARLSNAAQYERGLPLLDAYWEQHKHLDHDGWLRRHIYSFKASIMWCNGRPAEALAEHRALERFGLHAWYEHHEQAWGIGQCLVELGRHEEAIEVLEPGLEGVPEKHRDTALSLLRWLGRAYTALDRVVPARHAPRVRACAASKSVEVPEHLLDDPARLGEAIAMVYESSRPDLSSSEAGE